MRVRVLVAATVLALTLGGCGGSDSSDSDVPEYSAKPSATPSATQTTTGTLLDKVPDKPKRPKGVKSKAGAKAFTKYALQMGFYALATKDSFYAIADRNLCTTCDGVKRAIDDSPGSIEVDYGSLKVQSIKVTDIEGGFYTLLMRADFPKGSNIDEKTGKVTDTYGPDLDQEVSYNLQWVHGKWVLLNYDVLKENEGNE